MPQVAFYVRVSTLQQTNSQTIEQQLERLKTYCLSQGWPWSSDNIFRDDGFSGASLSRPGLDCLRDKIAGAHYQRVVITAPDRLARKYFHQMVLLEEFEKYGCQVEFLDRPMSQEPNDQLLLQIRGAVAEYERSLIADRLRRGKQHKYRAGMLLPWTTPPFGYRSKPDQPRDPSGVYLEEAEAVIIREIYAFYLQEGATLAGVAKRLTKLGWPTPTGKSGWRLASVRKSLTNPVYIGEVYAGKGRTRPITSRQSPLKPVGRRSNGLSPISVEEWILVGQVPAIVSQAEFEQVKAKLVLNKQRAGRNNKAQNYLLRSLVSCGLCKLACSGQTRRSYSYYTCHGHSTPAISGLEQYCHSRLTPMTHLDEVVWKDVCEILTQPDLLTQALERARSGYWLPQELQARRQNLNKAHNSLANQIERLTQAYLEKIIGLEEYRRRRKELEGLVAALQGQLHQLEVSIDHQQELAGYVKYIEEFCERIQKGLSEANFEQKRRIIELIIERIIVSNEQVEIRYVIPLSARGEQSKFYQLRLPYSRTLSSKLGSRMSQSKNAAKFGGSKRVITQLQTPLQSRTTSSGQGL